MKNPLTDYLRGELSDPAHEGVRLQPGRDGRVRCSAWLGVSDFGFELFKRQKRVAAVKHPMTVRANDC